MGLIPKKDHKKSPREIPKPTGPYSVGCTDIMTLHSPDGVFVRLFYPAVPTKDAEYPVWLPHESYLEGYAMFFKIWPPLFKKTFPRFVGDIHTPCAWDAEPLVVEGHQYPVLVFSHGLGGCRTTYTTFCLEMASRGIVVAAIEHRDYSACMSFYFERPETEGGNPKKRWMLFRKVKTGKGEFAIRNQQVHQRACECSRVLDMLTDLQAGRPVCNVLDTSQLKLDAFAGLLDVDRACAAGHSFGGATVIAAMAGDKRFKAGLGLDTWMLPLREETSVFPRVDQPMLFVNMEKFQTKENLRVMKQVQTQSPLKSVVTLRGTVHLNQCDVPFLCDGTMRRLFGASSRLNRFTAMHLTTNLCGAFLSKHIDLPMDAKYTTHIQQHSSVLQEGITSV